MTKKFFFICSRALFFSSLCAAFLCSASDELSRDEQVLAAAQEGDFDRAAELIADQPCSVATTEKLLHLVASCAALPSGSFFALCGDPNNRFFKNFESLKNWLQAPIVLPENGGADLWKQLSAVLLAAKKTYGKIPFSKFGQAPFEIFHAPRVIIERALQRNNLRRFNGPTSPMLTYSLYETDMSGFFLSSGKGTSRFFSTILSWIWPLNRIQTFWLNFWLNKNIDLQADLLKEGLLQSNIGDLFELLIWPYFYRLSNLLKVLVKVEGIDLSCADNNGDTPLHKAIAAIKIEDELERALHESTKLSEYTSLGSSGFWGSLWGNGKSLGSNALKNLSGLTIWRKAHLAQVGILDMLRTFVRSGRPLDLNKRNNKGETVLHLAASKGAFGFEIVSFLCRQGAALSVKTNEGKTPLDYAVESNTRGAAFIIDYLIDHGATSDLPLSNPNKKTLRGRVQFWSKLGTQVHDEQFLEQNKKYFEFADASGNTIFHKLIKAGATKQEIERFIKNHNKENVLEVNKANNNGLRPYDLAMLYNKDSALNQYLFEQLPWYSKTWSCVSGYVPWVVGAVATAYALKCVAQGYSDRWQSLIEPYGFSLDARWKINWLPLSFKFPFVKLPVTVTAAPKILPATKDIVITWAKSAKTF